MQPCRWCWDYPRIRAHSLAIVGVLVFCFAAGCGGDDSNQGDDRAKQAEATAPPAAATPSAEPAAKTPTATATPSPVRNTLPKRDEVRVPHGIKRTSSDTATSVVFQTPTGNSRCSFSHSRSYTPFLRCDFVSDVAPLAKPQGCESEWGFSIGLQPRTRPEPQCVSDAFDTRGSVLQYGETWSEGGIACTSRPTGLRCVNTVGHGFNLTRQRQDLF